MNCTKAIIPVAGYGTRRLPITKAIEKSMLPVGNRPTIDYVVQDLVQAGVREIIFVVSGDGRQLRDYYRRDAALEQYLREKGKPELIASITPPAGVTFRYVTQPLVDGKYGTSIPVWLCRDYIEPDESVFVCMGDGFIYAPEEASQMATLLTEVHDGEAALLGVNVAREEVSRYGVIVTDKHDAYVKIQEKPTPELAESTLISTAMYLLPPKFFEYIATDVTAEHGAREYAITDVFDLFVADGNTVRVKVSDGTFCDSGTVGGWIAANQLVNSVNKS